ncbi:hypothetical protein A3A75_03550 [Candidatus Woesebacteria bacterium RIFCSPLOWO2_01_FULL_39_10]|uniref:Uncharacterized protein n=1 Tax=Candidatus Woesebacteria bacterium RIFCSPLOWO2_01_FULL_39_10 TaxID=1802516 RepID=A0A1F8B963_9BACT|nr:MAG: hypothetical protein A3A75_03550 [Candidatus Woesebacteria bacterium RIFCSPLOWO2_01_FULL_39_10]
MQAKKFRFGRASPEAMPAARGISFPTKRQGEDTPSVLRQAQDGEQGRTISSWELHSSLVNIFSIMVSNDICKR